MAKYKHPDKHIADAIKYAEENGWHIEKSKGKGHAWGIMECDHNDSNCWNGNHCRTSIWTTPRNSQNHAKDLKKIVDKCIYKGQKERQDNNEKEERDKNRDCEASREENL